MHLTLGVSRPRWKACPHISNDPLDLLLGESVPKAGMFVPNGFPQSEIAHSRYSSTVPGILIRCASSAGEG